MIDLERHRRRLGYTSKTAFAQRLGIPVRELRRLENQPGYDPRFSRVVALADALGVPVDDLRPCPEADTPSTGCGTNQPRTSLASDDRPGPSKGA